MNQLETDFSILLNELGLGSGLSPIQTTIFAYLYLNPGDQAMNQVAKETGYSLASISNQLKILERSRMITRRKHPGSKKVFLNVDMDFTRKMLDGFVQIKLRNLKIMKQKLPKVIERNSKADKDQLKMAKRYLSFGEKFEKVMFEFDGILQKWDKL